MNEEASPFLGLNPFTSEHAEYFFGRDTEVRLLTSNILATSHLVVFGPSGAGKSSLLCAGVIPNLQNDPTAITILMQKWGTDPLADISRALRQKAVRATGTEPDPSTTLADTCQEINRLGGGPIVFVLDQFEDYFNFVGRAHRRDFEVALGQLVSLKRFDVHMVFGIRYDEIGRLDQLRHHIPDIMLATFELAHLGPQEAVTAVRGPIEIFNKKHGSRICIEQRLVTSLVADCRVDPIDPGLGVSAPLLQLALDRLWRNRAGSEPSLSVSLYERFGGISQIAEDHIEAVLGRLGARSKRACARMFELLLTRSGSKMAAAAGDLADQAGLKTAQVLRLLDQLVRPEYRILRVSVPHPDRVRQRYEIMHDRLADAILKWRARTLAEARKDADAVVSKRLSAVPAWDRWAVAEVVRLRACQPDKGEVSLKEASDHLGIAGERLLTVLRSFTKAAGFLTCSGCGDDTRIGVIDPFFGEALTGWLGEFENNRPFGCLIDLRDGSVIELVGGGELLGRAFHEHLRESFISRAHLLIMRPDRPDGDSTLLDLRSLNGTTLNAKPLNYGQFPELASNDVVILANVMPLIFIAASKFPELAGSESRWREELRLPAPSEDISGVVVSGMTRDYITLRSGEVYIYQDGTISTDERPSERSDVLIKLTPMKGRGIKVSFGDRVTDARHVNRERYQYYTDQLDPNESYLVQSDAPEKEDEGSDPEGFVSIFGRLQVNESFFEIVAC